jgi:SAM-dependent methyltransferase
MSEETRRFFDAIAARYDRVYGRERDDLRAHMERLLDLLGPAKDVLDLGIGPGPELQYLLDAKHRVVGLDISPQMVAQCDRRSRKVECIVADLWKTLPLADATFDAVIALFGTLAHPPNEAALTPFGREVRRVVRNGGLFYAEVPTSAWARTHPRFVDDVARVGIAVQAWTTDAWREALTGFDVAFDETESELVVIARSRG